MPENTLPAFAAALALGADEIEFDIRPTKDHQLLISHDPKLERISDGTGLVLEHTLAELQLLRVGQRLGWEVGFCTPEEVFAQFANRMTFNIHLKDVGEDGWVVKELVRLIDKYDTRESVYFAGSPAALAQMVQHAPEIRRVAIQLPKDTIGIEEMAQTYGCCGVQFWRGMFDSEMISRLHQKGMFCNLYYADTREDMQLYFDMGIDTLLTNRMDTAAVWRQGR